MKTIADIIKFVLTLFVHEQFQDYRLLYTVLDCSSHLYYLTQKKRKFYLYQIIHEHGVWADVNCWKALINHMIKFKIDDSILRRKNRDPPQLHQ